MKVTGNWVFTNNSANSEGGGIHILYSSLKHFGNSTFRNNSARIGGGIYAKGSTLSTTGKSSDKIGEHSGGSSLCTSLYLKNSAMIHGGAVYAEDSVLSFQGCNTFCGNSAQYYAGGVYSKNNTLKFNGSTSFSSNSGELLGGWIYGLRTLVYLIGNIGFTANAAARGGGEYLVNSFNLLSQSSFVTMENNNASEYGGAVYVEDSDPISYCFPKSLNLERCVFQVDGLLQISYNNIDRLFSIFVDPASIHKFLQLNEPTVHAITELLNISIHFYNNHAQKAGSAVYGGSIDSCAIDLGIILLQCKVSLFQCRVFLPLTGMCQIWNWNQTVFLLIHFKSAYVKMGFQTATSQNQINRCKCIQVKCSNFP